MRKHQILSKLPWALAIFIAIIFVQSLFFKFSNSFETQHIFGTIGDWLAAIGLPDGIANSFATYGGYTVGSVELLAAVLLLFRPTQVAGAAIAWTVISGAIFFHLFTPLGVSVVINEAGVRDGGQLFALACGVWLSALAIVCLRKQDYWTGNKTVNAAV